MPAVIDWNLPLIYLCYQVRTCEAVFPKVDSHRRCGGNEGLSLVTTNSARAEAKSCLDYAEPRGGKACKAGLIITRRVIIHCLYPFIVRVMWNDNIFYFCSFIFPLLSCHSTERSEEWNLYRNNLPLGMPVIFSLTLQNVA